MPTIACLIMNAGESEHWHRRRRNRRSCNLWRHQRKWQHRRSGWQWRWRYRSRRQLWPPTLAGDCQAWLFSAFGKVQQLVMCYVQFTSTMQFRVLKCGLRGADLRSYCMLSVEATSGTSCFCSSFCLMFCIARMLNNGLSYELIAVGIYMSLW